MAEPGARGDHPGRPPSKHGGGDDLVSRDQLLAQLRATDTYDADGFLGPIRLGPKQNNGCQIAMQVIDGAWQRLTPAQGFLC